MTIPIRIKGLITIRGPFSASVAQALTAFCIAADLQWTIEDGVLTIHGR